MNSRERFLHTINRKIPYRPPVFATFTPQVAQKMAAFLNLPYEDSLDSMLSTRASHMDLLVKLGNDAVGIATCAPVNFPTKTKENGLIENEWGMVFKPMGLYNEFYIYPLANAETAKDIKNHTFPNPFAAGRWVDAEKTIAKYGKTHGIIADLETTLFETAWYLVGLEKFLMDLMIKNEITRRAEIFGENEGYIVAPEHNIQDDTSIENILAFFEAAKSV